MTDEAMLTRWLIDEALDIVVLEGNIPERIIGNLRTHSLIKIWIFDENWSDGLPATVLRAQKRGQGFHDLPSQHFGSIRGTLRNIWEDLFKYLMNEDVREGEIVVRTNSMVPGEFHG